VGHGFSGASQERMSRLLLGCVVLRLLHPGNIAPIRAPLLIVHAREVLGD